MIPNFPLFKDIAKSRNYAVFNGQNGAYNLNIVGWRQIPHKPNEFNDTLSVYWESDTKPEWYEKSWPITTLPGTPWLINPMQTTGTAILVPGQYRSAYRLGEFRGYPALKQIGTFAVYRDLNQDSAFDMKPGSIQRGLFGMHLHKAGFWEKYVSFYSAGCQVFQKSEDYDEFMALINQAIKRWGRTFSYTLLEYES